MATPPAAPPSPADETAAGRAPAPAAATARAGTIAVMQPYFFPYLGTYQLAAAVDEFVFFDDVAFIKKGHIHRNALLLDGRAHAFSLPVRAASQNRSIAEHAYVGDWRGFLALVHAAYRRAPQFAAVMPLVEAVALDADENVARKNALSMQRVFDYLGLVRRWSYASADAHGSALRGQERILALCRTRGAQTYVNASGGRPLYDCAGFDAAGVALRFLRTLAHRYAQAAPDFVPHLSMIDVLMQCEPAQVRALIAERVIEA